MRKALALALAGLCFAAQSVPAAPFDLGHVEPVSPAHLGVALQTALPALNLPPAEMGTLAILAGRLQDASLSLPDLKPQAELSGPAAAQVMLTSVGEIRAKYSDDQLRNMPAGELNAVGLQLIDRLQGATTTIAGPSVTEPRATTTDFTRLARPGTTTSTHEAALPPPARSVYLLSKPLEVSARLGPVAQVLHYVFELGFHAVKTVLLLKAGVHAAAVGLELAWSIAKAPAMISIQSMADLQTRYWWTKRKTLTELARIPDVERIAVLTGTETRFNKIIAAQQDNRGLIFLETSKPLREMATLGHGDPLLIADPRQARVQLSLSLSGNEHPSAWTPSLQDLLDKKPIPDDVAAQWRREIHEAKKDKPWLKRFFDFHLERGMKVEAVLIEPSGKRTALGALAQGQSVKKLLGITRVDIALRALRLALILSPKKFADLLVPPPQRSIPLGDTTVERRPSHARWRDVPARLWRRLMGRLILV